MYYYTYPAAAETKGVHKYQSNVTQPHEASTVFSESRVDGFIEEEKQEERKDGSELHKAP